MRKLSRGAYEDTKGLLRVAETLLEVIILAVVYYLVWRSKYDMFAFAYKGKYVLMALYAIVAYLVFQYTDCTMFGQLNRVDLIIGQIISLLLVNGFTYLQLCLIENALIAWKPMVMLFGIQSVIAVVLIFVFTTLYHKLYAPHNMLLIYGTRNGVGLKFKMDARKDKYNITGLICAEEGYDAIVNKIPKYDAVILNDVAAPLRNDILKFCYRFRVRTYLTPKLTDIMIRGAKNISLFDTPLLLVKGTGLTPAQRVGKRAMDIAGALFVLLVIWQGAAMGIDAAYILPSPVEILVRLWELKEILFLEHLPATMSVTALGLCISVVLGLLLAISMDWNPRLEKALYPVIVASQTIPTTAIAPLFILWFGYGIWSKVLVTILITFFPIAITVFDGLKGTKREMEELLITYGATKKDIFLKLKLPTALPNFFSAIKMSVPMSVIGAAIAEWLGAQSGLGYFSKRMMTQLDGAGVFAPVVLLSVVAMLTVWLITLIENKVITWRKEL